MKNPLRKRYLREVRHDLGKYIVIMLLLVVSIGFVSGFEVADQSIMKAYHAAFIERNVEDGNFVSERKLSTSQKQLIDKLGITVYDLPYYEMNYTNASTIRIYAKRDAINRECLMAGAFPTKKNEIAVDRMYAENNALSIGDHLEDTAGNTYTICGLVALSDYSTLFQNNSDLMFDAVKFGVAIVTIDTFAQASDTLKTWAYAWKYKDTSIVGSDNEESVATDLMQALSEYVVLEKYTPRYLNQAITFAGEDMGSDGAMMIVFLDMVMCIIAFVYAITTKDTIQKEASVIGTLRASGFTVSELVRHYMVMPLLTTVVSACIGNLLGYSILKDVCAQMYYGSYSLPSYETIWNADAFYETTIIPCLIMFVVTWTVLQRNLSLSPLQFLRNDLSRKKKKYVFRLKHSLPFFSRFRLRVLFQNASNYVILFIGIVFGNMLLMFGLALPDILHSYQNSIQENMIANYQTILSVPNSVTNEKHRFQSAIELLRFTKSVETENPTAEKFSLYTLQTKGSKDVKADEVMVYGIAEDSHYVQLDGEGVYVSYLYADKYGVQKGDSITLYEKYDTKKYTFPIAGVVDYKGSISVFMPQRQLNKTFDLSKDFFAGYFSDTKIEDIPQEYIGSIIDYDALTKVSRQLTVSMGNLMYLVDGFCVGLFIVLMYLLSKIVIEKNTQSISMTKILGYSDREIMLLYIRSMTQATVLCIVLSIPICSVLLIEIYRVMLKSMMTGWILFDIQPVIYAEMVVLGIVAYSIVAVIEMRKIRRIPMQQALKNVE